MERLEIINTALGASGIDPVSTYDSQHPAVQSVNSVIDSVSKSMQTRGWWFNRDNDMTLAQNTTGEVILPSNVLSVKSMYEPNRFVQRGKKMYDNVNHTFIINRELVVNIISLLDIEDLPEEAADYVKYKTAYDFFLNDDGDLNKHSKLYESVSNALIILKDTELRNTNVNSNNRIKAQQMYNMNYIDRGWE